MKRKSNKKLTLILVLVLLISVGYAALASNLKINGITGVKSATWDVYWNNVQITQGSVATPQGNQARITDQAKTQVEYSVTLNEPGDFYEFTVDAVNNGTIDAMIAANGIVDGVYTDSNYTQSATLPDAIKYSVTYADGTAIAPKHLLSKKNGNTPTTETYKVRIEYRNDNDVDPEDLEKVTNQTYYFKFSVNYVQADGSEIEVPHPVSVIRYVKRQNTGQITPGDVIRIGETEDFYVISSNPEKTILLAKYNLLVGEIWEDWDLVGEIQPTDPGYGLQSIEATGYDSGDYTWKGSINFSDTNYWMDGDTLIAPYNENNTIYYDGDYYFRYRADDSIAYPYVYDENSNAYQYISGENGYINKLISMGAPSTITGRLLSYNDNLSIIENLDKSWTGVARGYYNVVTDGIFGDDPSGWCYSEGYYGVRPVIEIPTSEIN